MFLCYCWIVNTDLNWGKWGLQDYPILVYFMTLCMRNSWIKTIRKIHSVPWFFHLWLMAFSVMHFRPKALKRLCNHFQKEKKSVSKYVSHLLFHFFKLESLWVAFERFQSPYFVRQVLFREYFDYVGQAVIRHGGVSWNWNKTVVNRILFVLQKGQTINFSSRARMVWKHLFLLITKTII